MQSPEQCAHASKANRAKPTRLVVTWRNCKVECGAGFVPHSAVIRRGNPEPVLSRREVRIKRLSAIAHILPVGIVSFQLDAETVLLGCHEAERRVVDFEIASRSWKVNRCGDVERLLVGCDLLD